MIGGGTVARARSANSTPPSAARRAVVVFEARVGGDDLIGRHEANRASAGYMPNDMLGEGTMRLPAAHRALVWPRRC
jgi:hypothetical protein